MEAEETERDIQTALDQSGIAISREELSLICPITQQKMRNPVINTTCGHSYDRFSVYKSLTCFYLNRSSKGSSEDLIKNVQFISKSI